MGRCDASPGVEQPVAVNAGDEKAEAQSNDAAEFASASSSLPLTVAFALPPSVRSLAKVDLVGASDEEPFSFAGHLSQLADEVLIRMIGPKVKCPTCMKNPRSSTAEQFVSSTCTAGIMMP